MIFAVDVISDVICPWCFIGKRRLERAVAALGRQHEVRVRRLPFQLNPTMPKEGISRREYGTKKFGSWERSLELDARAIEVGQSEGITFAFDRIERTPNTLETHRLIWLADDVVPFADSVELVKKGGLPASALIEVGNDHRLADLEPLRKMLVTWPRAEEEENSAHKDVTTERRA